jgi:hypothetical protein
MKALKNRTIFEIEIILFSSYMIILNLLLIIYKKGF